MKNFEHGSEVPKNLLQELQAKNPDRNVAFTAVDELKNSEQMKQFLKQYVEWLKEASLKNPEDVVKQNIDYIVKRYDKETAERWMQALSEVSHP